MLTLASSITHPTWSLFMPKATGSILGSSFQTRPSTLRSLIFWKRTLRSVSCSQTFTSKTTIDLATGFFFQTLTTTGLAAGLVSSSLSSPKRSSFFSSFFLPSSFLPFAPLSAAGLSPAFFPPRKASWASLGSSVVPTSLLSPTIDTYQLTEFWYFFLCPSPNMTSNTTERLLATERSAIERESPTRNFFSPICLSKKVRNLLTSSINLPKSIFSPCCCLEMPLTAGSNSQVVMSSHWSIRAAEWLLPLPQSSFLWARARYLAMVLEEKKVPSGVSSKGRALKAETWGTLSPVLQVTSSTWAPTAAMTDFNFLVVARERASALQ